MLGSAMGLAAAIVQMQDLLVISLGYILGSIPFALLVSQRRGVDLRRVGSGNVGAANVLRTSGVSAAVVAMCLDALKGSVAVLLAQRLAAGQAATVAAGCASVLGHIHPVWLGFRGGKGVATAAGVFGVLAPVALAVAGGVFVVAVWITRYISVGSLAAAVTLAFVTVLSDVPAAVAVGAAVTAAVIAHQHRGNLSRLFAGTERRIGQRLF
jgi:glycerol-3-phosphate acyltransferase PlsY